TPLVVTLRKQDWSSDPRTRFFALWAVSAFVFFSISKNKLPGYILPVLPPLSALLGVRLARSPAPRWALAGCAALLVALPLAADVLPQALASGIRSAWPPDQVPFGALGAVAAVTVAAAALATRNRAGWALALVAAGAVLGIAELKRRIYPALDHSAGSRALWAEIEPQADQVCIGDVRRHVEYGLEFYGHGRLPACADSPRPVRVEGDPPRLER
ncbi:MAG: hypothetical protein R2748_22065, partial [Bryobacterales bacterium]